MNNQRDQHQNSGPKLDYKNNRHRPTPPLYPSKSTLGVHSTHVSLPHRTERLRPLNAQFYQTVQPDNAEQSKVVSNLFESPGAGPTRAQ